MIYRKRCELEIVLIEGYMGGKGTVEMRELLCAPEEIMGKGGAYVRHTLNPGVSTEMHTREDEMEIVVIVSGKAVCTAGGREQYLEVGDMIAAQPGNIYGIAQEGTEPLILTTQILYAQTKRQRIQGKARML